MVVLISVGADMTLKSLAIGVLVSAVLGSVSVPARAQSSFAAEPANLPPSSFSGRQYVDNSGCIYVRAGFDGNTTWVPRVTRSRQPICGQPPTFTAAPAVQAAAPAVEPAPRAAAVARPVPAPATAAARTVRAPAPAPAPRVVRTPASKPQDAEPPRVLRRVPVTTQVAPVLPRQRVHRLDAKSCRYGWVYKEVNGIRTALNCRPVSEVQGSLDAPAALPGAERRVVIATNGTLPGDTRIVPRHVYENRVQLSGGVPGGYRPAWEDDRLNPYRAWQTVEGYRATQRVWTNTVPRHLVTERPGFWQPRTVVREPVIAYRATVPALPMDAAARYVEVGAFTTEAKARSAMARLSSAGLPVRHAAYKDMTRVLVGPYADPSDLQAALARVHGTGYVQARLR